MTAATIAAAGDTIAEGASPAALARVAETARSFLACRDQLADILAGRVPPAANLAEAIERDFLFFDLERAAEALREALQAVPVAAAPRPVASRRLSRR